VSAQPAALILSELTRLVSLGSGVAALALAAALSAPAAPPALASELDVLTTPTPTVGYVLDDGQLLSKAAIGELQQLAKEVEESSGQRITVVTLRKLQFTTDVFEFADKVIEHWYPSAALGDKKGVLLLVKASKEGALVGGPSLSKALGGALLDSISSDNIAVYSEQEKFGEALTSSLKRVAAKLAGSPDPGPPSVEVRKTGSNFKTKEETEEKKGIYGLVVGGLLVISFVVPMGAQTRVAFGCGAHTPALQCNTLATSPRGTISQWPRRRPARGLRRARSERLSRMTRQLACMCAYSTVVTLRARVDARSHL